MTGAALTIGYSMPGLGNEAGEILTAQKAAEQVLSLLPGYRLINQAR